MKSLKVLKHLHFFLPLALCLIFVNVFFTELLAQGDQSTKMKVAIATNSTSSYTESTNNKDQDSGWGTYFVFGLGCLALVGTLAYVLIKNNQKTKNNGYGTVRVPPRGDNPESQQQSIAVFEDYFLCGVGYEKEILAIEGNRLKKDELLKLLDSGLYFYSLSQREILESSCFVNRSPLSNMGYAYISFRIQLQELPDESNRHAFRESLRQNLPDDSFAICSKSSINTQNNNLNQLFKFIK